MNAIVLLYIKFLRTESKERLISFDKVKNTFHKLKAFQPFFLTFTKFQIGKLRYIEKKSNYIFIYVYKCTIFISAKRQSKVQGKNWDNTRLRIQVEAISCKDLINQLKSGLMTKSI